MLKKISIRFYAVMVEDLLKKEALKRAYEKFVEEVDRIYKREGIDWIIEKTKGSVTKEDLKKLVRKGSYEEVITGNAPKDKDFVNKFKELFNKNKDGNKEILHDLLWQIMPSSVKQMVREIEIFLQSINPATGKRNTWAVFEEKTGFIRQAAYYHIKGYHYPEREKILALGDIITPETRKKLLKELYGVEAEVGTISARDAISSLEYWSEEDKKEVVTAIADKLRSPGLLEIINVYLEFRK